MGLSEYEVVAFATHGLVAGELEGLAESALVLTPPTEGSEAEDGLLTASEIAALEFDADWVILSACNTAAADGTPSAATLSGIAKSLARLLGPGGTLLVEVLNGDDRPDAPSEQFFVLPYRAVGNLNSLGAEV